MKVVAIGADISNNDVSVSDSLVENIEKDIPKLLELGAKKAALTNITGDDIVIAAFVEDALLETVNAGIVEILKDNAEDLGDVAGISQDLDNAGEGISYAEANLEEGYYQDAIIMAFDTYGVLDCCLSHRVQHINSTVPSAHLRHRIPPYTHKAEQGEQELVDSHIHSRLNRFLQLLRVCNAQRA